MHWNIKRTFLAVFTIGVFGLGGDAQAGNLADPDWKNYPGAVCQGAGTQQTLDYWFGRVVNRSWRSAIADCPVVRDTRPGSIYVTFWAVNRNRNDRVRCTFYNFNNRAARPEYKWHSGQTERYHVSEERTIRTLGWFWDDNDDESWGSAIFGCRLPGRYYETYYDDVGGSGTSVNYSELVGFRVIEGGGPGRN